MDVKTAFLNNHLSKDAYMVQPKGFVDSKHPNKVCKLQCSIYGLKQASRSWNKRSKQLIALSQSAYLEKIIKKIRMENSKKGYTSMMEKPDYRKSQVANTPTEVQRMQRVHYALAIGYVFVLNGRAVDWKNAKQSTTVMSSTEAEYIVVAEASIKINLDEEIY
nr:reverse transcriptase [Tanacetum cinerariifolium]